MKKHILTVCGVLVAALSSAMAQTGGPLTPPGAPGNPATVMPSLTEIYNVANTAKDLRTVIPAQTATYTISQPGSYVLGGDITVASGNGLVINSGGVTLDLNGFAITSTESPKVGSFAVSIGGVGVRLHGGRIRSTPSSGFGYGIGSSSSLPTNLVFEDLSFEGGVGINGIHSFSPLTTAAVCRRCTFDGGTVTFLNQWTSAKFGKVIDCEFKKDTAVFAEVIENCVGVTNTPTDGPGPDGRYRIYAKTSTYTINQPGSYVLCGDISGSTGLGVVIDSNHVTLDLNGFKIYAGVYPIYSQGRSNIRILNGSFDGGLIFFAGDGLSSNLVFENLVSSYYGIEIFNVNASGTVTVRSCSAHHISTDAARAKVIDCTVSQYISSVAHVVNCTAAAGQITGTTVVGSTP